MPACSSSLIPRLLAQLADTAPTVPDDLPGLLTCLAQVPDPRRDQRRRHPLAFVLSLAACAVLAGAKALAAIAEWAADAPPNVLAGLGGSCREPDRGPVAPAVEGAWMCRPGWTDISDGTGGRACLSRWRTNSSTTRPRTSGDPRFRRERLSAAAAVGAALGVERDLMGDQIGHNIHSLHGSGAAVAVGVCLTTALSGVDSAADVFAPGPCTARPWVGPAPGSHCSGAAPPTSDTCCGALCRPACGC